MNFIQKFGSYSFVCIYFIVSESITIWLIAIVVLLKYQQRMALLPFIFCWCDHIFSMIIQKEFFYLIDVTYSVLLNFYSTF